MNLTRRHGQIFGTLFLVGCAIGIAADLIMVLVLRIKSISLQTWLATEAHPTLIAAGVLATVGVAALVRDSWWKVLFAGMLGGHLFIHL